MLSSSSFRDLQPFFHPLHNAGLNTAIQNNVHNFITEIIHNVECYSYNTVENHQQYNFILYGGNDHVYLSVYKVDHNSKSVSDISKPIFMDATHGKRITLLAFANMCETDYRLTFAVVDSSNTVSIYQSEKRVHSGATLSSSSIRIKKLANFNAHKLQITGLKFTSSGDTNRLQLVSVSEDHKCILTTIQESNKCVSKTIFESFSALSSVNIRSRNSNEIVVGQHFPATCYILDLRENSARLKPSLSLKYSETSSENFTLHDSDVHPSRNELIGCGIGTDFCICDCRGTSLPVVRTELAHSSSFCKRFKWAYVSNNPSQELFATTNPYDTIKIWDTTSSSSSSQGEMNDHVLSTGHNTSSLLSTYKQNHIVGGVTWTFSPNCLITGGDRKLHSYCI